MSEFPHNPELEYEEQAHAIIEHWKSQGVTEVYRDPTRGKIIKTRTSFKFDINDDQVLKEIIQSISRGHKYPLE